MSVHHEIDHHTFLRQFSRSRDAAQRTEHLVEVVEIVEFVHGTLFIDTSTSSVTDNFSAAG
jgi:hypothetical protein